MKVVALTTRYLVALVAVLTLTMTVGVTASSATESEDIDREAVSRLHDALVKARADGIEVEGDISEEALISEFENSGLTAQAAPNGCSTPKALKKAASKWNKLFKPACDKHDRCYSKDSKEDRIRCDTDFRANMKGICKKKKSGKASCYTVAVIYFEAVRAGGKSHYKGKGSPR